jgi:hypothetical protein
VVEWLCGSGGPGKSKFGVTGVMVVVVGMSRRPLSMASGLIR